MGACTFVTLGKGRTAKEAFRDAVEDARYEHGHGGYTGTIAEKDRFKMVSAPEGLDLREMYNWAYDKAEDCDKWGAAKCVEVKEGWLFFGLASS